MTFADLQNVVWKLLELPASVCLNQIVVRLSLDEWDEFQKQVMQVMPVEITEANFTSCRYHGIRVEVAL